ncbi:MAG: hypothetical protein MUE37_09245 [Bacteroidales bacterium]|jgi:glycine cleavage system H lipoate-binding protein|nr:hypothetical protein [Bacteroidales bacterium]
MKQTMFLVSCLLILQTGMVSAGNTGNETRRNSVNEVNVFAGQETKALTMAWIEAFRIANPEAKVNPVTVPGTGSSDIQIITSNNPDLLEINDSWKIVVGRDVLVPLMGTSDPLLESISGRGISPAEFAAILSSDGSYTWGRLLGTGNSVPVSVIIPDDDAALGAISAFSAVEPEAVTAERASAEESLTALGTGKQGTIVFCRLADITARTGMEFIGGIRIIPVDVNGNGKSDYFEQFYGSFDSFTRGVYIGKYPKSLCNNVYAVSEGIPAEGAPSDFISFILVDGQRLVAEAGFTALARGEGMVRSETLTTGQTMVTAGEQTPVYKAWLWLLAIIATVSLLAYALYLLTRSGIKETVPNIFKSPIAFSPETLVTPAGILYDRGHAWTFMEKDGTVRVGIDDFLQHVTGSITRIKMRSAGEKIRKGEHVMSVIQNGKQLDIQSPVSGTIVARNEQLMNDTAILHSSPYDAGWVYSVVPENWEKESRLLSAATRYAEFLRDEFTRIKDFLAGTPGVNDVRLAHVVLQDGGELRDGLLEEFGPEVWEEFQMRFLDSRR